MYKFFLPLIIAYLFAGCTPALEPKAKDADGALKSEKEQLPQWVNDPGTLRAVGSSPVNFQGIYTQQLGALNQAKSDLAHSIKSYITSVYESELKTGAKQISNKSSDKVTALSEVFIHDSYQVDAYIDSEKKLYVLVEISKNKIDKLIAKGGVASTNQASLPLLKTRPFDKEELMQSRCYPPKTLEVINTESKLYQNKPVWFFRPNQNGVVGAVGIAEKEEGVGFVEQKNIALSLAKSSLAKRQKTQIESEHELLRILRDETSGNLFETSSIVKSATRVHPTSVEDIWLDPHSCELYVWVSIK